MAESLVVSSTTELRVELLVGRAGSAARAGDLEGALRVVRCCADPDVAMHRDVLDLRARIHAQRGELAEAEQYWELVLVGDPGNASAAAGLVRVRRLERAGPAGVFARRTVRVGLAAGCAVVALGVAVGLSIGGGELGGSVASGARSAARSAGPERGPLPGGPSRPAGEATSGASPGASAGPADQRAEHRRATLDGLARDLRAPGRRVTLRPDSVEVVFDRGIFATADRLTGDGARQLTDLGRRLAEHEVRARIVGHVAAVSGAPTRGGSVTALWRALIAARELSEASGKPLTDFTTSSADRRQGPHRAAAGNRTVTVLVFPEG